MFLVGAADPVVPDHRLSFRSAAILKNTVLGQAPRSRACRPRRSRCRSPAGSAPRLRRARELRAPGSGSCRYFVSTRQSVGPKSGVKYIHAPSGLSSRCERLMTGTLPFGCVMGLPWMIGVMLRSAREQGDPFQHPVTATRGPIDHHDHAEARIGDVQEARVDPHVAQHSPPAAPDRGPARRSGSRGSSRGRSAPASPRPRPSGRDAATRRR